MKLYLQHGYETIKDVFDDIQLVVNEMGVGVKPESHLCTEGIHYNYYRRIHTKGEEPIWWVEDKKGSFLFSCTGNQISIYIAGDWLKDLRILSNGIKYDHEQDPKE